MYWTEFEPLGTMTDEVRAYIEGGRYGVRGVIGEWAKVVHAEDGVPVNDKVYSDLESAQDAAEKMEREG